LFEVGRDQDRQVATLLERNDAYENVSVVLDDAGAGRVVMAYAKG
jgi:release factor glutamine methyltransferase